MSVLRSTCTLVLSRTLVTKGNIRYYLLITWAFLAPQSKPPGTCLAAGWKAQLPKPGGLLVISGFELQLLGHQVASRV